MTQRTIDWFKEAVPAPNRKNFHVQLGCHIEEFVEMCDALDVKLPEESRPDAGWRAMVQSARIMAKELKEGRAVATITDMKEFVDGAVDQRVTAIGLGHMIGLDMAGPTEEVDNSNYSKFVDGKAVFDQNGKIAKGPGFFKPNLSKFLHPGLGIRD